MATADCHTFSFMEETDVKKKVPPTQQGVVYVWWGCGLDGQIMEQEVPEFPVLLSMRAAASSSFSGGVTLVSKSPTKPQLVETRSLETI